jgi:hypothetical protein
VETSETSLYCFGDGPDGISYGVVSDELNRVARFDVDAASDRELMSTFDGVFAPLLDSDVRATLRGALAADIGGRSGTWVYSRDSYAVLMVVEPGERGRKSVGWVLHQTD